MPDLFTDLDHDSGSVGAEDVRKGNLYSRPAESIPEVNMIEGCGFEFDDRLCRCAYFRVFGVFVTELIYSTMLMDSNSFQKVLLKILVSLAS